MSNFTDRASSKLEKLSPEQIKRIINNQNEDIILKNRLLDSLDTGLLVLNSEAKIVFCNEFLSEIYGFNKLKVMNSATHVSKIIQNQELLDYISVNLKNTGKQPLDIDYESTVFGNMKIRVSAKKIEDTGFVCFKFMDTTFFEKVKTEFKKNESLAQMTTMAATVAHEIKNPLASISIYLQLLNKKLDKDGSITKDQANKSLSVIGSEIERLNTIIVDFLFAVKPMNVSLKLSDLNSCVTETMELARAEIENEGIFLELNLGVGLPKVNIDNHLVEQCILNLVRNSIQAMSDRQKENFISLSSFIDGNFVKLSVTDSGCGMSSEQLAKVFEPYYTTKTTGSGLGLTTIFKIMKEHDGEVTVTSKENEGSTFTLVFPVPKSERRRLK